MFCTKAVNRKTGTVTIFKSTRKKSENMRIQEKLREEYRVLGEYARYG